MIERGQIYNYDFGPRSDRRQEGKRPALVVQTDRLNKLPNYELTIVVPLTTKPRPSPTYVLLEPTKENGLREVSYAKCEQIFTLTYGGLGNPIGKLSKYDMSRVGQALKLVLELD